MGFGGGAMIGSPLATNLMAHFATPTSAGVWETMVTMGLIYFLFMMFGVFTVRVPEKGWKPAGWVPKTNKSALVSTQAVAVDTAFGTVQFWLLWIVLFLNVTAGIGILEQASPMIQDLFKGHVSPVAAAGFVGLLSLFNMGGRVFWSSTSDFIGRKPTYMIFFVVGALLYWLLPATGGTHLNSVPLFVLTAGLLISMYGGGFATIPAYLKDLFGGYQVSAIHGRLLTAWATAGIAGPLIVNGILDHYTARQLPK
jgi:MFS family permease